MHGCEKHASPAFRAVQKERAEEPGSMNAFGVICSRHQDSRTNMRKNAKKKNAPGVFIRMRIRYNAGGQKEGIRFLKHGSGGTLNVCREKTGFRKQQTSGDGPEEDFLKNGAGSRHRIPAEKAGRMRTVYGERKR